MIDASFLRLWLLWNARDRRGSPSDITGHVSLEPRPQLKGEPLALPALVALTAQAVPAARASRRCRP